MSLSYLLVLIRLLGVKVVLLLQINHLVERERQEGHLDNKQAHDILLKVVQVFWQNKTSFRRVTLCSCLLRKAKRCRGYQNVDDYYQALIELAHQLLVDDVGLIISWIIIHKLRVLLQNVAWLAISIGLADFKLKECFNELIVEVLIF